MAIKAITLDTGGTLLERRTGVRNASTTAVAVPDFLNPPSAGL